MREINHLAEQPAEVVRQRGGGEVVEREADPLEAARIGIASLPQRWGASSVIIIGIAGVVIVLVSVLSIAQGFAAAMEASGSPVRALVMRSGADSEMTSGLSGSDVDVIKQAPGISRDGQTPLAPSDRRVLPEEEQLPLD